MKRLSPFKLHKDWQARQTRRAEDWSRRHSRPLVWFVLAYILGLVVLLCVGMARADCRSELPKIGPPVNWDLVRVAEVVHYACPRLIARVPEYSCVATHTVQAECQPVMTYYVKFLAEREDGSRYHILYEVTTERQRAIDDCVAWYFEMENRILKAHEDKLQ